MAILMISWARLTDGDAPLRSRLFIEPAATPAKSIAKPAICAVVLAGLKQVNDIGLIGNGHKRRRAMKTSNAAAKAADKAAKAAAKGAAKAASKAAVKAAVAKNPRAAAALSRTGGGGGDSAGSSDEDDEDDEDDGDPDEAPAAKKTRTAGILSASTLAAMCKNPKTING